MFSLFPEKVGLTIEKDGVRFVKIRKRKGIQIQRTGFLPVVDGVIEEDKIKEDGILYSQLQPWIKEQNLKGHSVTIAVPTSQVIVRKLKVPAVHEKELKNYIDLEIQTSLYLPFDDPVYDYALINEAAGDNREVIVFAAQKSYVSLMVELLEACGVRVTGVDIPALALYRILHRSGMEIPENLMVVYFKKGSMELYMYYKGVPEFMRQVELPEMSESNFSPFDAFQWSNIVTEINRMLNFYQFSIHEGEKRISDIVVMGLIPNPELIPFLQNEMDRIHIRTVAFDSIVQYESIENLQYYYSLPFGLSLKEGRR